MKETYLFPRYSDHISKYIIIPEMLSVHKQITLSKKMKIYTFLNDFISLKKL